jgi:hypothetical protein
MDYKLKYIKYKVKYLNLKKYGGGNEKRQRTDEKEYDDSNIDYVITNYYDDRYIRSIAEVIPHGLLKEKMTNHGLGSGIYGFIDEKNASDYNKLPNSPQKFHIKNPLVLQNNNKSVDGEYVSDNTRYSEISNLLNRICYKIIVNNISEENYKNIIGEDFMFEFLETTENNNLKITDTFSISISDLVDAITQFIIDYKILLQTNESNENYVYMPINYLLYNFNYDGIYNKGGDTNALGSVKYFFNYSYSSRGYPSNYKKREPLKGKLIFNTNILDKKDKLT